MRLKEDAMLNGQLKPAYNLQHAVDAQYITWLDVSPRPTDVTTLVPFLKDMERHLSFKYTEICADAGYESEEAYVFLRETASCLISSRRTMRSQRPGSTGRTSAAGRT